MSGNGGPPFRWGRAVIVDVPAEIDISNARHLEARLIASCDDAIIVIADMSGTIFCDSAGVKTLLTAFRALSERGVQMRLVVQTPQVERVIILTGVHRLVRVFSNLVEALAGTDITPETLS